MMVEKNKLTVIMFVLAMTSTVCGYSQSDIMLISGKTMTADERQLEIFQEIKTCFEAEDVRVIKTKKYEVLQAWADKEWENERMYTLIRIGRDTNLFVGMSTPKEIKKAKGKQRKIAFEARAALFEKVQTCLARENILAIETKDAEILQMWIKEDDDGRNISTNFDATTGVHTAVSSPKTDGNGRVLFRKID